MFQLGIDQLLKSKAHLDRLKGRRIALLAHPASMTSEFRNTLDVLNSVSGLKLTVAFGPQHGIRGEKQDNMQETADTIDSRSGIPVYSLYGEVRRPSKEAIDRFDILLVDLQDVGTRIYTFLTTLLYVMEECAKNGKPVWILDRPNPAGRPVEGSALKKGWVSFVGAAEGLPMRHGLTLGEAALWFKKNCKIDVELEVIAMQDYDPTVGPGYGWPAGKLSWVNPSPNAAALAMARCYPGTVLLEGTHLSEGRGTTHPLEIIGGAGLEMNKILSLMQKLAPQWLAGCDLRECHFQPTFHKFSGQIISGLQIHCDHDRYRHLDFKPYRLIALWLKAIRLSVPEFEIWRDFHYEYEKTRLAFDLINGGPFLREWVDDPSAKPVDLDAFCSPDEKAWIESRREFLLYKDV